MDVGDITTMVVGGILLAAFATTIFKERQRRRRLVSILGQEARGLCREAADLGEAMCERWTRGELIDGAVLDRYALSEPQTYPRLVPSLWRLPEGLASRHIELHGYLSLARTRFAAWRGGERSEIDVTP